MPAKPPGKERQGDYADSNTESEGGAMAPAAPHHADHPQPLTPGDGICLGRTCLAWEADGELKQNDVQLILQRLCEVDAQACQVLQQDWS
jgi:hypothetical protein